MLPMLFPQPKTMSNSNLYRTLLFGVNTGHLGIGPKNRPVSRSAAKRAATEAARRSATAASSH